MVANRKVLITGGTGKIGASIVEGIVSQGGKVLLAARNMERAREAMHLNNWPDSQCTPILLDLSNNRTFQVLYTLNVDTVIHCARSLESLRINLDLGVSGENWIQEMNMGVMAPYEISRILMKTGKLRDIIFISSMYGVVGPTPSLYENFEASSPVQYGVVKAAQIHLSKELAIRFKPIRVNTISYGGFEGRVDDDFKRRYAQLNPSGRMLLKHDVYGPIDMILNYPDMAITGQNIIVDGGWTTW